MLNELSLYKKGIASCLILVFVYAAFLSSLHHLFLPNHHEKLHCDSKTEKHLHSSEYAIKSCDFCIMMLSQATIHFFDTHFKDFYRKKYQDTFSYKTPDVVNKCLNVTFLRGPPPACASLKV